MTKTGDALEQIVDELANEKCRALMNRLVPHYSPIYLSGKKHAWEGNKGEHHKFMVETCEVMKIRKELGMKGWPGE